MQTIVTKKVGLSKNGKEKQRRSSNKGVRSSSNRRDGSRIKAREEQQQQHRNEKEGGRSGKKHVEVKNGRRRRTTVKAPLPPNYVKSSNKSNDTPNFVEDDDNLVTLNDVEIDTYRNSQDGPLGNEELDSTDVGGGEEEFNADDIRDPEPEDVPTEERALPMSKTEEGREAFASKEMTFSSALKSVDAAFYALGKYIGESTCHAAKQANCAAAEVPQETSPYDTVLDGEAGDSTNEKALAMSEDSQIGSIGDDATAISEYPSNDAGVIV
jgi:hypothetical protein